MQSEVLLEMELHLGPGLGWRGIINPVSNKYLQDRKCKFRKVGWGRFRAKWANHF